MCCISLRTACWIVAGLQITFSVTAIAAALYLAFVTNKLVDDDPSLEEILQVSVLAYAVLLALHISSLAISILLIKGIKQNRPNLMIPFIYGQIVILIMFVSFSLVDALFSIRDGEERPYTLADLVFEGAYIAITVLFIYPVNTYYRRLIRAAPGRRRRIYVPANETETENATNV